MTDRTATISVKTTADLSGTQELTAALSREALAAGDAAAALALMDQALGKTTQQTQTGTAASLSAARAEASLAVALGDRAGAIAILETELATQEERTNAVIRAEIQLTTIENQVVAANEKAAASAEAEANALAQKAAAAEASAAAMAAQAEADAAAAAAAESATAANVSLSESLTEAKGAASALTGAMGALFAVKAIASLTEDGAAALRTTTSFNNLAKAAGTTGDALMSSLKSASHGEISDLNLQLEASKAEFLGVAKNAGDFSTLMAIARNNAQAMGLTTQEAFDKLVDGLDKGSARALKQVGLNIDLKAAQDRYAQSIGTTASQLTEEGKKQALVQAVMQEGLTQLAATGGAADNASQSYEQFGASLDNVKTKAGELLALDFQKPVGEVSKLLDVVTQVTDKYTQWTTANSGLADAISADLNPLGAYNQAVLDNGTRFLEWTGIIQGNATAVATQTAVVQNAAQVVQASTTAALNYANSLEMSTIQAAAATQAAQQKSNADQVAAVDAQTHTLAEQALAAQAQAAAAAMLASGAEGAREAALLAGSSQQVDVLTAAYYRLQAAQAAAGAAAVNAGALADQRAGERSGGTIRTQQELDAQTAVRKLAADHQRALQAAEDQAAIANATNKNQKLAALQSELAHTTDDIQRVNIQSQIEQETSGGTKRAGAAAAGGTKLASIEESTGNKIAKIISDRDAKLAALDKKYADEQLENQRKLGNDIANLAGNRRVNDETDDLDLVGKHTPDEARKLNDRERAEQAARQRSEANAEEARKKAEAGDADAADKTLQIREQANAKQEELDQKYYEKQAELGKNPELQAALKQQYDEATKAIQDQSDREVAQEDQLAQIKKDQRTKEHDDIILAATDAANVVIGQSQRMADGVVKATSIAKSAASANLNAIGDAVNKIPSDKTITIHVNQDGSTDTVGKSAGTSGSGTKAAGGIEGVTHGPTTLTVGDNPGGVEAVSVTPISGKGQTTVGPGMIKMAGGGTTVVDSGGGYTSPVAVGTAAPSKGKASSTSASDALKSQVDEQKSVVDLLESLIKLREDLNAELQNGQPFNTAFVVNLADRAASFLQIVLQRVVPITKKNGDAFALYVTAAKDAIGILGDVADLRKKITEDMDSQPFDTAQIAAFAWRAQQFLTIVESQLVPTTQTQVDALSHYQDAESAAISILKDVADLRKALADSIGPQPDLIAVSQLALTAARITQIVEAQLLPTTEDQAKALSQYHDAAESSISIIKDTSDLAKTLTDNTTAAPIDLGIVQTLATGAARVTSIVEATLIPTTDDQAKALQTWSDAVGASVSVIKDVSDLGKTMTENASLPLDMAEITRLANDAKRVTAIVQGTLTPTTEDQAKSLQNWSDAVGAGVSVIKDTTTLTSTMFTDYVSPTDAQIAMIAKDAKRVTDGLSKAAATYSADGLTAGKAYADMAGATFGAFKDGLLFFDALKSGDYALDTKALSQFETSTATTLEVARRLGAVAATIPAGNLAALGATTTLLSNQAEAMIKLAAVPFADLPGAAAGLANQANALLAGGGGSTTIYNTWQISGVDPNAVANLVLQKLNAQMGTHK